ncbi:MAG TPA: glucan 1,4-alpha-glucosidase, partial [Ktedonobacteraceae bacterium]|nr:glucan 1,4-alpha-glucosidase [Ktedonobacteraceae bacterium]
MSFLLTRRWRVGATSIVIVLSLLASFIVHSATASAAGAQASDGPGDPAYFDLARKDCLGTAQNNGSKVWFTLADGVLSDVYYPTIDNTNVKTLQYLVSDGSTFTDLQTRDTTYTVSLLDEQALDCRVTSTARNGKYRIVTDYLTDPGHNSVVMHIHFTALIGKLADYQLYVRYDPTINGNGGGGASNAGADSATMDNASGRAIPVAYDTSTTSTAANRTYATPVYSALAASRPFLQASNGFAGAASDGLTQLTS